MERSARKGWSLWLWLWRYQSSIARFYSFRDPAVDATVERFEHAADWLSSWNPSETEFVGYVVSTVAGMDAPAKPRAIARRQDMERLSKRPAGCVSKYVLRYFSYTSRCAGSRRSTPKPPCKARICVFGERSLIDWHQHTAYRL